MGEGIRLAGLAAVMGLCFGLHAAPVHGSEWLRVHDLSGSALPTAPKIEHDGRDESICRATQEAPRDDAELALKHRGWLPWRETVNAMGVSVTQVAAAVDFQCRPLGVSIFVHREGRFLAAFVPADVDDFVEASIENDATLVIRQRFAQPGESGCCKTGLRSLKLPLDQFR